MSEELTMDISKINFEKPKRWKVELWLKKAKECLNQITELETELESMEAPRSFECEAPKFKVYWKLYKKIDNLYKWMRKIQLSNYPIASKDDLIGFIEYWEIYLEENGGKDE